MREIGQRFRVDYAFMLYTQAQDLYPRLLRRSATEVTALARAREEDRFRYNLMCIDAWRAGTVVPYAMSIVYFQPDQIHFNGFGRATPREFCSRLGAVRPSVRGLVMQPGDVIDAATGAVQRADDRDLWGASLDEFLTNIAAYARTHADELPAFSPGDPEATMPRLVEHLKANVAHPGFPARPGGRVRIHIYGGDPGSPRTVTVNTGARTVSTDPSLFVATAELDITMPASIADVLVNRIFDPYSVLYCYRIELHCSIPMRPLEESNLYSYWMTALFAPELLAELRGE